MMTKKPWEHTSLRSLRRAQKARQDDAYASLQVMRAPNVLHPMSDHANDMRQWIIDTYASEQDYPQHMRALKAFDQTHTITTPNVGRRMGDDQTNAHDGLQGLRARIGPLHVVNGHMPLAAGEVAEMRPKLTFGYVMGVLVDLGATLGFLAFVLFLLSRAVA